MANKIYSEKSGFAWKISTATEEWGPVELEEESSGFDTAAGAYRDGMNTLRCYTTGMHVLQVVREEAKEYSDEREELMAFNNNGEIDEGY